MRKIFFIGVILLLVAGISHAQKLSIENVYKMTLRNSDAIRQGSDVKGYYFFYISDQVDKHTNEYTLRILDNNLKLLKDIKFQDSKDVSILESSFNGTDLIFLLYNKDQKSFEYQVYGADGNKKFSYLRELTNKEKNYLAQTYFTLKGDEEKAYKGLYPIEGIGFISNMPSREDKDYTFQLDFFSSDKRKQWTYIPTQGGKKFLGDYLGTFSGVVFIEILRLTSMFDQKPDSYIVGLSLENGREVFNRPTDGKYRFYPASISTLNEGQAYIYGEYFEANANVMKDKSLGFAFWTMDEKGKLLTEKYCSWESDLGKFLNVSSKGKIENFGFMYLHNIFQTSDGSIFAVGEGFMKVASALGIISRIALGGRSGGLSTLKVKITDMMLIRFDKDLNVKDAKIYDKGSNSVELQSGMEFVSTPLLGKLVKYTYGEFDYVYTQTDQNKTAFSICYSDYVREKEYKGGTFNSISFNEGKITTDRINTKSDASKSFVLPGKLGQVLIVDYYKKDKRLDLHFEKLN